MNDIYAPDAKDDNESPTTKISVNEYSRRSIYEVGSSDNEYSPKIRDDRKDSKDEIDNVRIIRNGRPARGPLTKSSDEPKIFVPKNMQKSNPRRSFSNESESVTDRCGDTNSDFEETHYEDETKLPKAKLMVDSKAISRDAKAGPIAGAEKIGNNLSRRQSEFLDNEEDDLSDSVEDERNTDIDDESSLPPPTARGPLERRRSVHSEMEDILNKSPRPGMQSSSNTASSINSAVRNNYADFVKRNQALGVSVPRKSGRYDDEDDALPNNLSHDASEALSAVYNGAYEEQGMGYEVNKMLGNNSSVVLHASNKISFVMIAQPRGFRTELVQCTILRDRHSIQGKLNPRYELMLEEPKKLLIIAQKMTMNRTSNYHLFDMTRGQVNSKLSKKNGNYLGKLRARNSSRTEYALLNKSSEREEVAGVAFERLRFVDQLKDGNQPRKMKVVLPPIDEDSVCIPHRSRENGSGSLTDLACDQLLFGNAESIGVKVFESKDPVFENGNYRLNFRGRVNLPSVKNFQLVAGDNVDNIVCQFGKVDEEIFHLDFKAPLNAFQAFALALCQFNL